MTLAKDFREVNSLRTYWDGQIIYLLVIYWFILLIHLYIYIFFFVIQLRVIARCLHCEK